VFVPLAQKKWPRRGETLAKCCAKTFGRCRDIAMKGKKAVAARGFHPRAVNLALLKAFAMRVWRNWQTHQI
jgi:hypothetical protein